MITKKPIDAQFSDFGYTFGSFERSRFTIDTNGRANESGSVLYRVNAAQEDANGFVDFDYLSRTLISPTVSWQMTDNARLTYNASYHDHNTRGYQGVPVVFGDPLTISPGNMRQAPR